MLISGRRKAVSFSTLSLSNLHCRKDDRVAFEYRKSKSADVAFGLQNGFQSLILIALLGAFRPGFSEEFRAGAAKAKITPEELGWLGGYGHRNRPAEGVAADLWTRALALQDKQGHRRVLVSTDIHIFTREQHREIVEAVRKRHAIEERDLMLIATHTHSGPALPRGFDPGISWGLNESEMRKLHAASDRVRDQTLDAIARALADLQPAKLSFGRGKASFGVNRRVRKDDGSYDFGANPAGVADPDVPVLLIESTKGVPRAVVFTYACHCTIDSKWARGLLQVSPGLRGRGRGAN